MLRGVIWTVAVQVEIGHRVFHNTISRTKCIVWKFLVRRTQKKVGRRMRRTLATNSRVRESVGSRSEVQFTSRPEYICECVEYKYYCNLCRPIETYMENRNLVNTLNPFEKVYFELLNRILWLQKNQSNSANRDLHNIKQPSAYVLRICDISDRILNKLVQYLITVIVQILSSLPTQRQVQSLTD